MKFSAQKFGLLLIAAATALVLGCKKGGAQSGAPAEMPARFTVCRPASSLMGDGLLMVARVGASFTFVTVRRKMSLTLRAGVPLSVAITVILTAPTSLLAGVPEKVRVAGVKVTQAGTLVAV